MGISYLTHIFFFCITACLSFLFQNFLILFIRLSDLFCLSSFSISLLKNFHFLGLVRVKYVTGSGKQTTLSSHKSLSLSQDAAISCSFFFVIFL